MAEEVPVIEEEVIIGGSPRSDQPCRKRGRVLPFSVSDESSHIPKRSKISIFGTTGPPSGTVVPSSYCTTTNGDLVAYSLANDNQGEDKTNYSSAYDEDTENEEVDSQATEEFDSQETEVESRSTSPSEPESVNPDLDPQTGDFAFNLLPCHIIWKAGSRMYKCEVCQFVYRHSHSLRRHFLRDHVNHKYLAANEFANCKITDKLPTKAERMNRTGHDIYYCRRCDVHFSQRGLLIEHIRNHQDDEKPVVENLPEIEETFECEPCGKTFNSKRQLSEHQQLHDRIRPHKCKFCSKGFSSIHHQLRHEKIHEKGAAFPCKHCKMDFTKRQDLINHMNEKHKQETHFFCAFCKEYFKNDGDLERHLDKAHAATVLENKNQREQSAKTVQQNNIICSVCKRRFTSEETLREHMKNTHSIGRARNDKPSRIRPDNLRPDPHRPGCTRENMEENFYLSLAARISENLNFYLDGRCTMEADSSDETPKDSFSESKVPNSSVPWSIYNFPLTMDITHMMQVYKNRQSSGNGLSVPMRDFSLPFQELTDMSERTLSALGLTPIARNSDDEETVLENKFYICNVCKAVFRSSESVISHQLDDHPGVECSFFEYQGSSQVPNELLPTPVSSKGILSTVRLTIQGYDNRHRCTKCFFQFSNITALRLHAAECGTITSSQELKSSNRMHLSRRLGTVFSLYERRRYRPQSPDNSENCESPNKTNALAVTSECNDNKNTDNRANDRIAISRPRGRQSGHFGKTSDRPFSCRYCTKSFPSQHNHRRHERIHERGAPFLCRVCGCGFTQRSDIICHFRRNHREFVAPKEEELIAEQRLRFLPNATYNREGEDSDRIVTRTLQDLVTTVICWEEEEQELLQRQATAPPEANVPDMAETQVTTAAPKENQIVLTIQPATSEEPSDNSRRSSRNNFIPGPQRCKTCGSRFRTYASLRRHWLDECSENPSHFEQGRQKRVKIELPDNDEDEESEKEQIESKVDQPEVIVKPKPDDFSKAAKLLRLADIKSEPRVGPNEPQVCHICNRIYGDRNALRKHLNRTQCAIKNKEMFLAAQALNDLASSESGSGTQSPAPTESATAENGHTEEKLPAHDQGVSLTTLKSYEDSIDSAIRASDSEAATTKPSIIEVKVPKQIQESKPKKRVSLPAVKQYPCSVCDAKYSSYVELLQHRVSHRLEESPETQEGRLTLVDHVDMVKPHSISSDDPPEDIVENCVENTNEKPVLIHVLVPPGQDIEAEEIVQSDIIIEENGNHDLLAEAMVSVVDNDTDFTYKVSGLYKEAVDVVANAGVGLLFRQKKAT